LVAIGLILGVLTPIPVISLDLAGGGTSLILNGNATFLLLPTSLLVFFIWLVVIIQVLRQAPRTLQKPARLFFLGFLINTIIPLIMGQTSLQHTLPGLNSAVAGIGVLLMTIPIARHQKILFVLPLKAMRLTVLHTGSGIMLFTHTWDTSGMGGNEDIYAGMLQGVNMLFKESLNQGDVQEVHLANAIMLTYRSAEYPVACVLVAGKVSRTLRDALKLFAEKFYAQFADKFADYNNVSAFDSASALVAECFPFVPEYDNSDTKRN
ncbi:MAG TPA: hypothetical protein VKK79_01460, partial [Candidatus Lokiarchaeia archaeon]|nr:hypothetical protein [Candidatus Lokiarchaeia archaeon]